MDNIRGIKPAARKVVMADTRVDFGKCRVFVGNLNPAVAGKTAKVFAKYIAGLNERASIINMWDLHEAHLGILGKIKAGESILN